MRVRHALLAAGAAAALAFGSVPAATAATATAVPGPAAMNPCGFYKTASDAHYNHCTGDGSRIVIEIEVFGPNYEWCVGPGETWLGSASKIQGARYVGRTC
ncbi:DUF6355 family natural product biosynthesis protein [Streptomyces sp. NPDC006283]|uniref:DUF6355 family natural product biosynthesis protein n=1 Tax=Streptomyces sp. NPDC006283 TaxID=3156741 RepID=UPI0033B19B0E